MKQFFEQLESLAQSRDLQRLLDTLKEAPVKAKANSTVKAYLEANRRRLMWANNVHLPRDERGTLMYLAYRASSAGSGALARDVAAFQWTNEPLSPLANRLATDLIKSKKRQECTVRRPPTEIRRGQIQKIIATISSDDPASERDALMTVLSFEALLRRSEAAELKWSDVVRTGNRLEIRIRFAKNDQMGLGRTTFLEYGDGSDLDLLFSRWKARWFGKSEFMFPNLNNGRRLSDSAISSNTKKTFLRAGISDASHHSLRRGAANTLMEEGLSFEEIQAKGRWRSSSGLAR